MDNFDASNETAADAPEINFGKEIAKTLALSTAVSAGVLAGFMVVGLSVNKIQEIREARKDKKKTKLTVVK